MASMRLYGVHREREQTEQNRINAVQSTQLNNALIQGTDSLAS